MLSILGGNQATYKIATAADGSGQASSVRGGVVGTSVTSGVVTVNGIHLGSAGGASGFVDAYIKRVAAWSSRVSNTNLQSLTT